MKIILIVLMLLTMAACGQNTTQHESNIENLQLTEKDWKILKNADYSIQYPPDWELNQSGQMGTSFAIFSPLENDKDQFKENVNLLIQDLTAYKLNLNKYVEISEEQVEKMITNSALIESKRVKTEKGEYHKMIYTGEQGVFHLKFEQYFWIIDNKAFVLTFTSERDKFESFVAVGEKILNSFVVK
ncbi:MAG: PsbP-related protein [Thermoflexibacteraceae bacterium]|jgi:hypothetical protein